MTEEFLDAAQVAQVLGLSKSKVCKLLRDEDMPGAQLKLTGRGGKRQWRIPKDELQRWMDEKGMRRDIDYVW